MLLLQDCNPMLPTKIFLLTRMISMTFQAKMLHYALGHAFGLAILCFAMLLTQYAPKTRIIMLLVKSYFVLPCFFWHNMLQRQEYRVLQLISHVLGQKMKFTIHCYYSSVTIHLLLFTPKFCLFKGGRPLYFKQVFSVLSSGLLP